MTCNDCHWSEVPPAKLVERCESCKRDSGETEKSEEEEEERKVSPDAAL
jgi:hypothetical protein